VIHLYYTLFNFFLGTSKPGKSHNLGNAVQ